MKINQSNDDLLNHLREQIQFLAGSSHSFDNGFKGEAKRLATTIRILVHDTRNSASLLSQLDSKDTDFYNTALPHNPNNLLPHMGLMGMKIDSSYSGYWAPLDDGPPIRYRNPWVSFDTWWTGTIVIDDKQNQFTRKDLVLSVADQDGGAHVDPTLNEAYAKLSRENSMGWKHNVGGVENPVPDPHLVSIRQIAHEMIRTIQKKFPNLL